jgi:uncharacterized membrane protein
MTKIADYFSIDLNKSLSTYLLTACFVAIAIATSYRLGAKSIWYDEAISAFYIRQSFLAIAQMSLLDYVPPLYYWVLKIYSNIFGISEVALRSLSVIFNLGAAVYFWKLVKNHFGERASLYALVFFGTSNYLLLRAQTIRAYPLFLLLTIASIYYFFRAIEEDKNRLWFLYSLSMLCSLYSLYIGIATVVTMSIFVTLSAAKKFMPWHRKWLLWTISSVVGFLPWAILIKITQPSPHPDWMATTLPSLNLWTDFLILFINFFATDIIKESQYGTLLSGLLLLIVGLLGIYSLVTWRGNDRARKVLLFVCLSFPISVFVNYILDFYASVNFLTLYRYVFLCPFAYLVAATGISKLRFKTLQVLLLGALILPNVMAIRQTYTEPSMEEWRGFTRFIEINLRDNDLIIFSPGYMNIAFDFYASTDHLEIGYPKGLMSPSRLYWGYHNMRAPKEAEEFLLKNLSLVKRSERIWLVLSHNVVFDRDKIIFDTSMIDTFNNIPLTKLEYITFNGIIVFLLTNLSPKTR